VLRLIAHVDATYIDTNGGTHGVSIGQQSEKNGEHNFDDYIYNKVCIVWCSGQNKRIAPLSSMDVTKGD
jgi:hypothetical protein